MVNVARRSWCFEIHLSVLALSSRFDGRLAAWRHLRRLRLSVLALSSRFDGRRTSASALPWPGLSVLALSSRFDGLIVAGTLRRLLLSFQYSLCRVVLMVPQKVKPEN